MSDVICTAKHTKFQPDGELWKCPKCGADYNYFVVEAPAEDASEECGLLHCDDNVVCSNCDLGASGKSIAAKMVKKYNLVPCECCKGAGYVKKAGS
jgi:hypothetical protein